MTVQGPADLAAWLASHPPPAATHHLPPPLQKLLPPLLSQEPAAQLIRSTARRE